MAAGDNSTLQNNGAITSNSYRAYGMTATSGSDLTNGKTGTITMNQPYGYGMAISGTSGTLTNDGAITLNNISSSGLYAANSGTSPAAISVTNNGTITGKGNDNVGISASGSGITVTNGTDGTLNMQGRYNAGIVVNGAGSTVANAGQINISGTSGKGAEIFGTGTTFTNTGTITTTGTGSHELSIGNTDGSATGSATLTAWSVTLSPNQWTDTDSRPIAVGPGSTLNFANTRLILRPGSAASGFAFNQRYNVADMIDNDGTVTGGIGSDVPDAAIAGAMPMLKAQLYGSSASGAGNQQVSLSIEPEDNHGQGANSTAVHRAAARMWLLNRTLGNALDALVAASDWTFFIQPYYQHSRVTGSASSRSESEGLIFGAARPAGSPTTSPWAGTPDWNTPTPPSADMA